MFFTYVQYPLLLREMSTVSPSGCDDASSVTSSLGVATPGSEMRCAAGVLCRAHDGADLAGSTHHCIQCGKRMHCALLCGETVEDYIASGKSINIDDLCPDRRQSYV
jgi:hypothetical protein